MGNGKMKRYKLLKELPTFHAGDIFTLNEDGCLYLTGPCDFSRHWKSRVMAYHKNTLERFPNILEDWFEEIEEPKEYWHIGNSGLVHKEKTNLHSKAREAIGNRFESPEEAEKAVEKLKAWQRLKDKGFRFKCWEYDGRYAMEMPCILIRAKKNRDCEEDLDLLFGGEE